MFDIFYEENSLLLENFPFAKQVSSKSEIKSKTGMYWVYRPNIGSDYDVFTF